MEGISLPACSGAKSGIVPDGCLSGVLFFLDSRVGVNYICMH